jgi:hypothetical protein
MGVSLGGSYGQTSSSATSTGQQNQQKTFSPGQSSLQDQLGTSLASSLAASTSGGLSPGVQAQQTQAADAINTTSSGLTDRVTKFLAQRGFGKSGKTGQATLQGELGRQGALAGNAANFAGVQQNANSGNLLAALNYALTNLGMSTTASGSSTGNTSGWGIAGGAGFGK